MDTIAVTMHSESGREGHPAVNVKVNYDEQKLRELLPLDLGGVSSDNGTTFTQVFTEAGYTLEWIDAHVDAETRDVWWQAACEDNFALARELAVETFGGHVQVYSEGRSGGWLVVYGLGVVENWTLPELAKWKEFEHQVRTLVDDVPRSYLWIVHANVYEFENDTTDESTTDQEG